MNALTKHEGAAVAQPAAFSLAPRNIEEAFRLADMLADSDLVPKDFKGKPGNVLVAVQWGAEIGLKPLQALQNIAVINGRPCLWGDALIALVRSSPLCEYVLEEATADGTAVCRVKRRGESEQVRTFSNADAKTAGLLGKQGPWQSNPARMKQMRARAFALRDVFPDVLKGIAVAEEVMDYVEPPKLEQPPGLPSDVVAAWTEAVGRGTADARKFWASMTPDQRALATETQKGSMWALAVAADKERTVEAADQKADATVDPFVAAMERAEGEGQ